MHSFQSDSGCQTPPVRVQLSRVTKQVKSERKTKRLRTMASEHHEETSGEQRGAAGLGCRGGGCTISLCCIGLQFISLLHSMVNRKKYYSSPPPRPTSAYCIALPCVLTLQKTLQFPPNLKNNKTSNVSYLFKRIFKQSYPTQLATQYSRGTTTCDREMVTATKNRNKNGKKKTPPNKK